jgi:hypothetical protein
LSERRRAGTPLNLELIALFDLPLHGVCATKALGGHMNPVCESWSYFLVLCTELGAAARIPVHMRGQGDAECMYNT